MILFSEKPEILGTLNYTDDHFAARFDNWLKKKLPKIIFHMAECPDAQIF